MNRYVKGAMIFTGGLVTGVIGGRVYTGLKVLEFIEMRKARDGYFKSSDILFDTHIEAEKALTELKSIHEQYHYVRVADVYDVARLMMPYESDKFGWYTLKGANVKRYKNYYFIDLPTPVRIY